MTSLVYVLGAVVLTSVLVSTSKATTIAYDHVVVEGPSCPTQGEIVQPNDAFDNFMTGQRYYGFSMWLYVKEYPNTGTANIFARLENNKPYPSLDIDTEGRVIFKWTTTNLVVRSHHSVLSIPKECWTHVFLTMFGGAPSQTTIHINNVLDSRGGCEQSTDKPSANSDFYFSSPNSPSFEGEVAFLLFYHRGDQFNAATRLYFHNKHHPTAAGYRILEYLNVKIHELDANGGGIVAPNPELLHPDLHSSSNLCMHALLKRTGSYPQQSSIANVFVRSSTQLDSALPGLYVKSDGKIMIALKFDDDGVFYFTTAKAWLLPQDYTKYVMFCVSSEQRRVSLFIDGYLLQRWPFPIGKNTFTNEPTSFILGATPNFSGQCPSCPTSTCEFRGTLSELFFYGSCNSAVA